MIEEFEKRLIRNRLNADARADAGGSPASLVLIPPDSHPGTGGLVDLGSELVRLSSQLGSGLSEPTRSSLADLMRGVSCHYSNLIEGLELRPRLIDRALAGKPSPADPMDADHYAVAAAHIEVHRMIDRGLLDDQTSDIDLLKAIHRELCSRLPDHLLWVDSPDTDRREPVIPGEFRTSGVRVGGHHAVSPEMIQAYMLHFSHFYTRKWVGAPMAPAAIMASHHRLAWIHPFLDYNGRVARLHAHALFRRWEISADLWSLSRGFALGKDRYYGALARADWPRQGASDGRGSLSDGGLISFCRHALEIAMEEVRFTSSLLHSGGIPTTVEALVSR